MGNVLKIVGANTINLYDGPIWLYRYTPRAPETGAVTVTEPLTLRITGDTTDAIRASLNSIEKAIQDAVLYRLTEGEKGTRTFIKFQPGAAGDTYRSELLNGPTNLWEQALGWRWAARSLYIDIQWTRGLRNPPAGAWEADTAVALTLTNGGGSSPDGLTLYNHDDAGAGHDNYAAIADSAIVGVLPAPAKIRAYNSYNNANEVTHLWIGHGAFMDVTNWPHILEGESAAYVIGAAAPSPDASCSGGYYQRATWASSDETLLYRWDLATSQVGYAKGKRFRPLARFTGTVPAAYVRLAVTYPSGSSTVELQTTDVVLLSAGTLLYDLGEIDLPPWLQRESSDWQGVSLSLYGRKASGGAIDLDFVHPMPADHLRLYRPVSGKGIEYLEELKDDPDTGAVYIEDASSDKAAFYSVSGSPIMLYPGLAQRLYLLARDAGGSAIVRTFIVQAWYRPRRLTL